MAKRKRSNLGLPSNPCKWTQRSTREVYEKLGVGRGNKIPKGAHGRYHIDGWDIVLKRSGPSARVGTPRLFVDYGGREVPIGRVYQGLCTREVFRARRRVRGRRGKSGRFTYADPRLRR